MYGTKSAAVLRQLSGLFFIISVLLPIYPLLNQLTRAARYVTSQEGTRVVHPRLIPDSVIRALQQFMLPIRLGNKSNRQLKSTMGLDADSLPATNRDQAVRSTPLSATCADIAPFPD